jgi:hypothetical protein
MASTLHLTPIHEWDILASNHPPDQVSYGCHSYWQRTVPLPPHPPGLHPTSSYDTGGKAVSFSWQWLTCSLLSQSSNVLFDVDPVSAPDHTDRRTARHFRFHPVCSFSLRKGITLQGVVSDVRITKAQALIFSWRHLKQLPRWQRPPSVSGDRSLVMIVEQRRLLVWLSPHRCRLRCGVSWLPLLAVSLSWLAVGGAATARNSQRNQSRRHALTSWWLRNGLMYPSLLLL